MNRRHFITVLAAGGVIALLPGCDAIPASALAPWAGPRSDVTDLRLKALSWAMLAPNPHNLQSWLVDVRRSGEVRFHVDRSRLLPETDPNSRQILIGCGAFLELFSLAMAGYGQAINIETFPEGVYTDEGVDARPFAIARLVPKSAGPLDQSIFHTISLRRSSKVPYTKQIPGAAEFAALASAAADPGVGFGYTVEPGPAARLTTLARKAYETEFATPPAVMESLHVTRIGAEAIAAEPSGVAVRGAGLWWGRKLGFVSDRDLLDPQNPQVRSALTKIANRVNSTHAWGWLVTNDNSRNAQLAVGRSYLRLNLAATRLGLGVHPCSQSQEEFPAMREHYDDLTRELGVRDSARAQMLFRVGYVAEPVPPAPRRALDRIIAT